MRKLSGNEIQRLENSIQKKKETAVTGPKMKAIN